MSLRDKLSSVGACSDSLEWAATQEDPRVAWDTCERGDWLMWIAVRVVGPEHRMTVVLAACDCAETALVHVPSGENRPRQCIETVRAWTRGDATIEQVRQRRRDAGAARRAAYAAYAADAAYAAADAAADAAAYAAAYAAADAAYAAYAAADAAADAAYAADTRRAHLKKLAEIVRARIPYEIVAAGLGL